MSENSNGFRLEGRKLVVTGGARGIGYAIARLAAHAGAAVALLDLEQASVEEAAAKLRGEVSGAEVLTELCDVSSYEQVSAAAQALQARWGRTDLLVNNAGIAHHAPAETMSVAEWDRMLSVNLSGVFYCSQIFGLPMIAAGSGAIVNIASMSGLIVNRPQPQVAYNVAKAGVIMLDQVARRRVGTSRGAGQCRRAWLYPHRPHRAPGRHRHVPRLLDRGHADWRGWDRPTRSRTPFSSLPRTLPAS